MLFRSVETCGVYIDSNGKLSTGIAGGIVITGTTNYIPKINSTADNLTDSTIIENSGDIVLGRDEIILGDTTGTTPTILKAHDSNTTPISLIIKAGCDTSSGTPSDGYLYLDPGRGATSHCIYIGSSTYDKSSVGLIPEGIINDIDMVICGKNSGSVSLKSDGGVSFGTPSNLTCLNGACITKKTIHDFCITGYDTAIDTNNGKDVHIRGGNAIGLSSTGGSLFLCAGTGVSN